VAAADATGVAIAIAAVDRSDRNADPNGRHQRMPPPNRGRKSLPPVRSGPTAAGGASSRRERNVPAGRNAQHAKIVPPAKNALPARNVLPGKSVLRKVIGPPVAKIRHEVADAPSVRNPSVPKAAK
jgi:hypothetical protein